MLYENKHIFNIPKNLIQATSSFLLYIKISICQHLLEIIVITLKYKHIEVRITDSTYFLLLCDTYLHFINQTFSKEISLNNN